MFYGGAQRHWLPNGGLVAHFGELGSDVIVGIDVIGIGRKLGCVDLRRAKTDGADVYTR
jgi:hypothetical protein